LFAAVAQGLCRRHARQADPPELTQRPVLEAATDRKATNRAGEAAGESSCVRLRPTKAVPQIPQSSSFTAIKPITCLTRIGATWSMCSARRSILTGDAGLRVIIQGRSESLAGKRNPADTTPSGAKTQTPGPNATSGESKLMLDWRSSGRRDGARGSCWLPLQAVIRERRSVLQIPENQDVDSNHRPAWLGAGGRCMP